jgi:hypothetical protein
MNFTESFSDFSNKLGPMDLALYAGVGIVLWVLFKDKLSPVQQMILDLVNKTKNTVSVPVIQPTTNFTETKKSKDLFFDLVVSWKQTRDLAVQSGCQKAVEVADQMFPYLSPEICKDKEKSNA